MINAKFTDFTNNSNWVEGLVYDEFGFPKYQFQAKLFDEPSEYGIDEGRVSKLCIVDTLRPMGETFVSYDRGWDIKPTKEFKTYYEAVLELLENSPKRFEND